MPDAARPVVLITGASSGIGAATAAVMASTHHVVITRRRADKLDAVVQKTGVMPITADTDKPEDCERIVNETVKAFVRLDGLVLNASIVRAAAPCASPP